MTVYDGVPSSRIQADSDQSKADLTQFVENPEKAVLRMSTDGMAGHVQRESDTEDILESRGIRQVPGRGWAWTSPSTACRRTARTPGPVRCRTAGNTALSNKTATCRRRHYPAKPTWRASLLLHA